MKNLGFMKIISLRLERARRKVPITGDLWRQAGNYTGWFWSYRGKFSDDSFYYTHAWQWFSSVIGFQSNVGSSTSTCLRISSSSRTRVWRNHGSSQKKWHWAENQSQAKTYRLRKTCGMTYFVKFCSMCSHLQLNPIFLDLYNIYNMLYALK